MDSPVRFYLDEHVHPAVADGLRLRGADVLTTRQAGMLGASDEEQLALATKDGRILFTQDDDFLKLHAVQRNHAGIVYVRQRTSVGQMVRGLTLIFQVISREEMVDRVEFL